MGDSTAPRILAVLVLYRMRLAASSTFQTLLQSFRDSSPVSLDLLVFDNSPTPGPLPDLQEKVALHFRTDPSNGGLSAAYNCALELANSLNCEWILLLDQDSALGNHFLRELNDSIREFGNNQQVAAIVPVVRGETSALSPHLVRTGFLTSMNSYARGISTAQLTAINSGAAVRVSFLNEIGGFSPRYWLDFLDYWLFNIIATRGMFVALSGSTIGHRLSLDTGSMPLSRYSNMLKAEATFILQERPLIERPLYLVRLCVRGLRQIAVDRDPGRTRLTFAAASRFIGAAFFS